MNKSFETVRNGIQWVLDNRSSYQVAKDLSITNRTVNRYQNGETPIENMSLATAERLYNYYLKEMGKMENIKNVIAKVEAWEIGLVDADPNYHEIDYIDGASDHYIVHHVEGEDLEVFFAEYDHVKELRNEIYEGAKSEADFEELVINELSDQYDYDKVVAYRAEGGQIEWV